MLEESEIRERLIRAQKEHVDLDSTIGLLTSAGAFDQILVQRLKKRKLQLKDEIMTLSSKLIPDDIA
jgi:hypothetical protein